MTQKTIQIEVPEGKKAEWVDGVLTLVDEQPVDNRPVTERVKTFQDAREAIGEDHKLCRAWKEFSDEGAELAPDAEAYLKLRIIAAALNEGWEPQFTEDEWRYFPRFVLFNQEEVDKMSEESKHRVVYRSGDSASAFGGVSCAHAGYDSSCAHAGSCYRLAFRSRELAEYAGQQFLELWIDYIFKANN